VAVREPTPQDATAVARLLAELGYPASDGQAAERLERLSRDESYRVFVAELDGEIAGFATVHVMSLIERDEPGAVLAAIAVTERFRRRGVGSALVGAVEAHARARGASRLVLSSARKRADAHAFYLRAGFEHTGLRFVKELR
jgi:GNAT superfamily N-acetyltransferase